LLDQLKPVARQLDETYEALHISLNQLSDDQLGWSPGGDTKTVAELAQHIASANMTYASVIRAGENQRDWQYEPAPARATLLARIDQSQRIAHEALSVITDDNIHISRCDDWCPNCDEQLIPGPLDALWFGLQMARHTAYHLGQINLYLRMLGVGGA
jgi:uncharacterized damage-inducible protein DinB